MLDRDVVARPVAGIAGIEHGPGFDGSDRRAVCGAEVQTGVVARPHAVLAKVSTDHATRYRQDRATATRATVTRTAVGSTAAGATVVSAAAVCGRGTRVGLGGLALRGLSL